MKDFIKEIKLEPTWQRKYIYLKILLYILFLIICFFVSYKILFPTITLNYSFLNSNSLKNTLVFPRILPEKIFPKNGNIKKEDTFIINANPLGSFSNIKTTLTIDKKIDKNSNIFLSIKKAYQAFFYPKGEPVGFKNGTLIFCDNQFYIISKEKLRKFSSSRIIFELGFAKNSILEVSRDDLRYNEIGDDIENADLYIDDILIKNSGNYYKFENNELRPFISQRAFLSQYLDSQAIEKDNFFINQYPISKNIINFTDGTLASSEESVFILSNQKSYPIDNSDTFLSMGFNWENVIKLTPDEFGEIERQKQFTLNTPHPDGTIFFDKKTKTYSIVENMQLREMGSANIAKTYPIKNAIIVDSDSINKKIECNLKSNFIYKKNYQCKINLESINNFEGNDFELSLKADENIIIKEIKTTFFTSLSLSNLKYKLSKIKNNIHNNYTGQKQ